jgi:hypothetical protein
VVGDRPAHDSAAEGVEDHGQVHLAVAGGVFGDVHHPQAVRSSGVELAADEIIARLAAVATCAAASSRTVDPRDAGLALNRSTRLREQQVPSPKRCTRGLP